MKQQNKKTIEEAQEVFSELIDETLEYVSSVFLLRDLPDNLGTFVTADEFTEGLLQNEDLYNVYKRNDKEKMRQMIIGEAFSYADGFISEMVEASSWNDLDYQERKRKEEETQKGGRH